MYVFTGGLYGRLAVVLNALAPKNTEIIIITMYYYYYY